MKDSILKCKNIFKYNGNMPIINNISLELFRNDCVAIIGPNGAGKSALVNILCGVWPIDSGSIVIDGHDMKKYNPIKAQENGVFIIRQNESFFENLSLKNNIQIKLLNFTKNPSNQQIDNIISFIAETLNIPVSANRRMSSFSVGEKVLIQIALSLHIKPKILLLDEPFLELLPFEVELTKKLICQLKKHVHAVVFLSFDLRNIVNLCNKIYILHEGRIISKIDSVDLSNDATIQYVETHFKRLANKKYPKLKNKTPPISFRVEKMSSGNALKDVSFSLHKGEIMGITGPLGSGKSTLLRCIYGITKWKGNMYMDGCKVVFHSPYDALHSGLFYIPSDVLNGGVVPHVSFKDNVSLSNLNNICYVKGIINKKKEREIVLENAMHFNVCFDSIDSEIQILSCGNMEKAVLIKALLSNATILLMDDPTKNIDSSAKVEVYNFMSKFTAEGGSIILVSSDLDEVFGMCDTLLLLNNGTVSKTINNLHTVSYTEFLNLVQHTINTFTV